MKRIDIEKRLAYARDIYNAEIEKIQKDIREQLLIPVCDKHRLKFDAGMGSFSLENDLIITYSSTDWKVKDEAVAKAQTDEEYDQVHEIAKAFFNRDDIQELLTALSGNTMHYKGCTIGEDMESYDPTGNTK